MVVEAHEVGLGAVLGDVQADAGKTVTNRRPSCGSNPMVLHLSRGGFDPKEHRFLHYLVDAYLDFRVGYTRVA